MKILVLSGGSYISGAERITLDIIKDLYFRGHEVHCIVSGWTDGRFIAHLDEAGIAYTKVKLGWIYRSQPGWTLDTLLHFPQAYLKCRKIIKQFRPDVLYVHSYRPIFQLYYLVNTSIIYHSHDIHSTSTQGKMFLRWTNRKISRYIACSNFVKDDLIKVGVHPDKIQVIHNGIDTNVNLTESAKPASEWLKIGIVGQVIPKKGHEDVLEALAQCATAGLKVQLIITGTGDLRFIEHLKTKITQSGLHDLVEWRGFQNNPDEIYAGMDVLLAPTRTAEPFGLIVPEANARGIPVIVTNHGGFQETVQPGYNGFLVDPKSPDQIAQCIQVYYKDRTLVKTMGMNGRQMAVKHFDKSSMLDQVYQLFKIYER